MTMETTLMIMKKPNTRQAARAGVCEGKLNSSEDFKAGLVELSLEQYEPPHGEAYRMFARQRSQQGSATKEIILSFTKGSADGTYDLTPDASAVRLTFIDSDENSTNIYMQVSGKAELSVDQNTGVFSGKLKDVIVEYRVDETPVQLTINVEFEAINNRVRYTPPQQRNRAA